MYGPGRLHLGKAAVGTHLLLLLILFAATCLPPTGYDLHPVSQRGPASFADEAAIFNSTATILTTVNPSCEHEAVAELLTPRGGSPTTMLPSWTTTAATPVSTPTPEDLPDAPPDLPAFPFPELGLTTDDPEFTWLSPLTPYSFPDEFQERYGGLLAGYRGDDLSDPEDDDVCDLDEPQQQGYTGGMPWVQFSDTSASDRLEDTQIEMRRINTESMIREIGKSHTLRSVTIKVRVPYGIQSLTPAEGRQRFLQMPELDLLSRLRGVDHLVVQAPFALGAPETVRLQQCLAKPKGRRGRGDQPHLYPALALHPLSSDTLVRRPWSELDSELESYGEDPADFSTKISKAKKLERLRRLDWKNPDEPDVP
ncbi:uncharacterized protein J4E84_002968 [Alternaria hordeiaustralica]|uniref:uncharacterized protein n=1 Tax=Alternaria hordeiaustralica TaxID=1187925 RepID=UPI0020C2EEEA|nr:uncharacterized protein J4E84_002968 [Alternaria hordeiaustralica]KAI4692000.1 hypothetical protein J4E84_002968 [Alternaria hordeiaustralica]